jgi:hypothetical protein
MSASVLAEVLLYALNAQEAIVLCDHYLELHSAEDSGSTNRLRGTKSDALSQLGRNQDALAQLGFVQTSKWADGLAEALRSPGQGGPALKGD